jgi:hypothetical protein
VSSNDVQPLAREGGVSESAADSRDPFEALDDLMQVIEAGPAPFPWTVFRLRFLNNLCLGLPPRILHGSAV